MDPTRFDGLTRSLSEVRSRRGAHRFLGALALGGPLALLGRAETEAKRKKKERKKKKKKAPYLHEYGRLPQEPDLPELPERIDRQAMRRDLRL